MNFSQQQFIIMQIKELAENISQNIDKLDNELIANGKEEGYEDIGAIMIDSALIIEKAESLIVK